MTTTDRTATKVPAPRRPPEAGRPRPEHRSPEERRRRGRALREVVPLDGHAVLAAPVSRPDPVTLLEEQAVSRVPELVPIRYGRMLASPFAFLRGAARVMAADLADTPTAGLTVQLCGDAHLANFGVFGTPERRLVFDLNDFDETLAGPFEFDVKRLAASLAVAGRENGLPRRTRRAVVTAAVARYRSAMAEFAGMRDLDVWYARLDTDDLQRDLAAHLDPKRRKRLARTLERTRRRDSVQVSGKLTEVVDGRTRFRADPPLVEPLRDLLPVAEGEDLAARFDRLISTYRATLQPDRRLLLERYAFLDMARKVVGVGSVGTRCWIVLLTGRDRDDPLVLQVKEAGPSVYEEFLGASPYANAGERVVTGQRLVQQASDLFLGWERTAGIDGVRRDFYVRQLRDWKGSVEVQDLRPDGLQIYGELCGWSLARAHARSGDRIAISGYLGRTAVFEAAVAEFAEAYADRTEADHRALADAVASGRLPATTGV